MAWALAAWCGGGGVKFSTSSFSVGVMAVRVWCFTVAMEEVRTIPLVDRRDEATRLEACWNLTASWAVIRANAGRYGSCRTTNCDSGAGEPVDGATYGLAGENNGFLDASCRRCCAGR